MKKTIWTLTLRCITRINSEWVKGLNLRAKTIKLSEEKHEGHIHDVGLAAAAAKSLPSCLTLCDPIDGSPPGAPIPGILQARTLEWVAISFSKAWKWKVKVKSLSHVRLLATPWTAAHQAPLSVGFSRQKYWSGVPVPSLLDWQWYIKYNTNSTGNKKDKLDITIEN